MYVLLIIHTYIYMASPYSESQAMGTPHRESSCTCIYGLPHKENPTQWHLHTENPYVMATPHRDSLYTYVCIYIYIYTYGLPLQRIIINGLTT